MAYLCPLWCHQRLGTEVVRKLDTYMSSNRYCQLRPQQDQFVGLPTMTSSWGWVQRVSTSPERDRGSQVTPVSLLWLCCPSHIVAHTLHCVEKLQACLGSWERLVGWYFSAGNSHILAEHMNCWLTLQNRIFPRWAILHQFILYWLMIFVSHLKDLYPS